MVRIGYGPEFVGSDPEKLSGALWKSRKWLVRIQSQSTAEELSRPQAEYLKAIAAAYEAGFAFIRKLFRNLKMLWHGFFVLTIGKLKFP